MSTRTSIIRKCDKCGQEIVIDVNTLDKVIYFDKKAYHLDCFIESIPKKINSCRENVKQKWLQAKNDLGKLKSFSYNYYLTAIYKSTVYDFIRDQYNITVVPSNVWTRLDDIYKGIYKGMSEGISPEILLDMWQRKINFLNKTYQQNIVKGKPQLDISRRIIYDLAILVNKYDSYKNFIEKQKIVNAELNLKSNDMQNLTQLVVQTVPNIDKVRVDNFSDLVDDIFD